jgi:hypothetical protein
MNKIDVYSDLFTEERLGDVTFSVEKDLTTKYRIVLYVGQSQNNFAFILDDKEGIYIFAHALYHIENAKIELTFEKDDDIIHETCKGRSELSKYLNGKQPDSYY